MYGFMERMDVIDVINVRMYACMYAFMHVCTVRMVHPNVSRCAVLMVHPTFLQMCGASGASKFVKTCGASGVDPLCREGLPLKLLIINCLWMSLLSCSVYFNLILGPFNLATLCLPRAPPMKEQHHTLLWTQDLRPKTLAGRPCTPSPHPNNL